MSVQEVTKLAWDLEHADGLLDAYRTEPDPVLARYALTEDERRAIRERDATHLLAHGVNPVALRNLMVLLGVSHGDMYKSRSQANQADFRGSHSA